MSLHGRARLCGKVFLGKDPQTGKERQKWIGGFRSAKEARDHLLAVAAAPAYGSGVGPYGSMRVRLGDYLQEWLQSVRQSIWRWSTAPASRA